MYIKILLIVQNKEKYSILCFWFFLLILFSVMAESAIITNIKLSIIVLEVVIKKLPLIALCLYKVG